MRRTRRAAAQSSVHEEPTSPDNGSMNTSRTGTADLGQLQANIERRNDDHGAVSGKTPMIEMWRQRRRAHSERDLPSTNPPWRRADRADNRPGMATAERRVAAGISAAPSSRRPPRRARAPRATGSPPRPRRRDRRTAPAQRRRRSNLAARRRRRRRCLVGGSASRRLRQHKLHPAHAITRMRATAARFDP